MIHPSSIHPDKALATYLKDKIHIGTGASAKAVAVYSDWERPTNDVPTDFLVVYINGDLEGVGMDTPFAKGYLAVSLYCKLNNDGSVKQNRIEKILEQFDNLVEKLATDDYFYEYDSRRFITPTTPNQTAGYSITTLNLRWTTTSNIINQ